MIFDIHNRYTLAQAITGTSAVASTDHIKHGTPAQRFMEPYSVLVPVVIGQGGTGASLIVRLQTATLADFSDAVTVAQSPSIAQATLVAGYHIKVAIPPAVNFAGYSRLTFQQAGTAPTITVSGYILPTSMVNNLHIYPASNVGPS